MNEQPRAVGEVPGVNLTTGESTRGSDRAAMCWLLPQIEQTRIAATETDRK